MAPWALEKRPLNHEMSPDTERLKEVKDYLTIVQCISHSKLHKDATLFTFHN